MLDSWIHLLIDIILTYNSWFCVDHDQTRLHTRLTSGAVEEREIGVIAGLGHEASVGKDAMLQAVELPACVCYLHSRLPNVYLYDLTPAGHVAPQLSPLTSVCPLNIRTEPEGLSLGNNASMTLSNNLIYIDFGLKHKILFSISVYYRCLIKYLQYV